MFDHVTVIPMDTERRLPDHTVLIRNGWIEEVGPSGQVDVPDGVARIDGRDRFLIPGLADMHCHLLAEADLTLLIAHGVTRVRNMFGMPRHLHWRQRIANGDLLGPELWTTGPVTDGRPTMRAWTVSIASEADADLAVRDAQAAGYDAIKVYDHLTSQQYKALASAARRYGIPFVGHIPFSVGLETALVAGHRSIEHLYGYVEALQPLDSPIRQHQLDPALVRKALFEGAAATVEEERIGELAEATKQAGVWNCPTLMIRSRHLQTVEELMARPEMRYVSPIQIERWRQWKVTYPYDNSLKGREVEIKHLLTKALHEAGAGLLAGTDTPVHFLVPGPSLHEELAELVTAGLSPYHALTTATQQPAAFFGESDEWGAVAAGKRADLLLLNGDPLVDIANCARIEGVMVGGEWLSRTDLDDHLEKVEESAAAQAQRTWTIEAHDAPLGRRGPVESTRLRYEVEWGAFSTGAEEVLLERASDGTETIRSWAQIETFGVGIVPGMEAGKYENHHELDPSGRVVRVHNTSETADGRVGIDLRLDGDQVHVVRDTDAGHGVESVDVDTAVHLGMPFLPFFIEVTRRARELPLGEQLALALVGPGMPPDFSIASTSFVVKHQFDDRGGSPHFDFMATRPNAFYSGSLWCDQHGLPVEIVIASRPTEITQRVVTEITQRVVDVGCCTSAFTADDVRICLVTPS